MFQEALSCSDTSWWMVAMEEEMEALHKNQTWELVTLPKGWKAISNFMRSNEMAMIK